MFALFDFDLPGAVTEQLERRLNEMASSSLTSEALEALAQFQQLHQIRQGVYQLLLGDEVLYVGKASDVCERLRQHFDKMRGRLHLELSEVRFRCLLLHSNWNTSANEDLLVAHYKARGQCRWNNSGFGAKDVGRERDDTEPNRFDREYPINADYPCSNIPDCLSVGDLLGQLKAQLPFVLRYDLDAKSAEVRLDLKEVPKTARALVVAAVKALGSEWQATFFRSHVIVYKERRRYKHGKSVAFR